MATETTKLRVVPTACPKCQEKQNVWVIDPRGADVTCSRCAFKFTVKVIEETP